jgi:Flp pilus assembly protein TadG
MTAVRSSSWLESVSRRKRLRLCNERGAQLVEFALVLPVVLMILAGVAEFGLIFRSASVTAAAAREGARLAAIPGYEQDGYAAVQTLATGYLTNAGLTGAAVVTVTPENLPISSGTAAPGVRVTVQYTYNCLFLGPIVGLVGGTFNDTIVLGSAAVMRTQSGAVAGSS